MGLKRDSGRVCLDRQHMARQMRGTTPAKSQGLGKQKERPNLVLREGWGAGGGGGTGTRPSRKQHLPGSVPAEDLVMPIPLQRGLCVPWPSDFAIYSQQPRPKCQTKPERVSERGG